MDDVSSDDWSNAELTNSTDCGLRTNMPRNAVLSLDANVLDPDNIYEFVVTVTSPASGNCNRERKATARRRIWAQINPVPNMTVRVCEDPLCKMQIKMIDRVATINANRRKPMLFLRLQASSDECSSEDMEVLWATSKDMTEHILTKNLMENHTMKHAYETLKIRFDYTASLAAEYTFTITAKCSGHTSASEASVNMDVEMNYGPSGGKMEVNQLIVITFYSKLVMYFSCVKLTQLQVTYPTRGGFAAKTTFKLYHSIAWYDTNTEPPFRYTYSAMVGKPMHGTLAFKRGDILGPEITRDRSTALIQLCIG